MPMPATPSGRTAPPGAHASAGAARRQDPVEFLHATDSRAAGVDAHAFVRRYQRRPRYADERTRKELHVADAGDADREQHRVADPGGRRIEMRVERDGADGPRV